MPTSPEIPMALLRMRQARVLLILTTVFWGLSFPLSRGLQLSQKELAPDYPDAALGALDNAIRFGIAAILLALWQRPNLYRITSREWSQALGLAAFSSVGLFLQTLGLLWTDASVAAFLTQFYSLLVPLFVALRDRRWPGWYVWVACGLVLTGVALLSPQLISHAHLGGGEIVVLISTAFLACQIIWVERPVYAENRAGMVTLVMFAGMSLFFSLGVVGLGGLPLPLPVVFSPSSIWIMMGSLILFCTILSFWVMNAWQQYVSAVEASMIYCLEPAVATFLSTFMPDWISRLSGISYANEKLTGGFFLGAGLILSATILVALKSRLKRA